MFSSPIICTVSAHLNNPDDFKGITMYLDGHDNRVDYSLLRQRDALNSGQTDLYSHKFKAAGVRTQALADINRMILAVSKTEKCGKVNDGSMFANMNILSHMSKSDLLQLDGAYLLMINRILENDTSNNFSRDNFICLIRKINTVDFELDETKYNERFGGMRSTIETLFADIAWKF
jgi:hypothetical protein